MAAAGFFAAQRRPCHQAADRDQRRNATAIGTERRVPFIEGLDRRFLGQTYGETPGTPFLDRLRDESLSFENFFSNGVETSRGLFATFCSYYPRHGAAAMTTRSANDYAELVVVARDDGQRRLPLLAITQAPGIRARETLEPGPLRGDDDGDADREQHDPRPRHGFSVARRRRESVVEMLRFYT